ncbi:MAG TPA: DNA-directed RNA polymerase subunit beta [Candidatus Polarisedimenticolia bacterium]|nr:DNA-directed RNA polymerase subunit beta [Candidatus Polarisedimenticolia bacterium]
MEEPRALGPRDRIDFSKIRTSVPIPNLIEVQKHSYERFLQMYVAPSDREDIGLQAVFKSLFPIHDFRETSSLEFVEYSIGNWECKCGNLEGIERLRSTCGSCGKRTIIPNPKVSSITCPECGTVSKSGVEMCDHCGDPVALKFKYDVAECQERGMNFTVPLKVTIRLVVWDKDPESGSRSIRDIKQQEVYFGEIPMLTENGTFIINGTERVIVSQLHRSPGVFFQAEENKTLFTAKLIPYRGSWVEFEYDTKNLLYVRIDRKRKFLGTIFLRALGIKGDEEILRTFYQVQQVRLDGKKYFWKVGPGLANHKVKSDILDPKTDDVIVRKGKRVTPPAIQKMIKSKIHEVPVDEEELKGVYAVSDIVNKETGEVLIEINEEVTPEALERLAAAGVDSFEFFVPEYDDLSSIISETLAKDPISSAQRGKDKPDGKEEKVRSPQHDALVEIYKRMRPGDPPTRESSESLFKGMFEDPRRYDISRVGRLKFNTKLATDVSLDQRILSREDFVLVIKYLLGLRKGIGELDDIDHLGNRRVRSVGELLENQFRIGLIRMERAIKEKMSVYQEMTTAMPHDLINAKPVMAAIQEFFGSSQLSQFMDQTNPLSEVTHKRRLSALGPGGLSRERAGFEVRDVHATHYGRICPIETPEGPNIGLISSLSCYARINEFGFIESPYRRVGEGAVKDYVKILNPGGTSFTLGEIVEKGQLDTENRKAARKGEKQAEAEAHVFYLSAWEEDKVIIAQANAQIDDHGKLMNEQVRARRAGEFKLVPREEVNYIDVSPKQLVSVAASLIPFLENDDANRALMGSNMQRQAVPLLKAEAPLVGTGMEAITAKDSGAVVVCQRSGVVDQVDSQRIIVRVAGDDGAETDAEDYGADIYTLTKFKRSNQNTCISQKPLVRRDAFVKKGEVLADGPCTDRGELALGRNVLVAFMPWRGYNFEDAILVSEKLVKEDYFTSIHIEEFEIEARDTKLGAEEITRDIPNVSEEMLKDLDESGIIRIGAHVKPGNILIGKITPKGETQLTPEEKLLRAIFGEKSGDVRDASLTCPPGIEGTVVDVDVFCRKGVEKDSRAQAIEDEQVERMKKNLRDEERILREESRRRLMVLFDGEKLTAPLKEYRSTREKLAKGIKLTKEILSKLTYDDLRRLEAKPKDSVMDEIRIIIQRTERKEAILKKIFEEKREQLKKGDELSPGVIKMVKVYVAMKRKLQVGDKMAGRHGNKGVIARILPEEEMPYLPDGTPVEIVLNPLGVPSRMNVGQILETHLGWAAKALNLWFASPVFDGASEEEIKQRLEKAGHPRSGKSRLYDGRSGEAFDQLVTVGYIYMLKLSHLVDDKIHARSIGPYSLITQQPLGGKAQFGGQRFGEMEVWALEAYGAAHILQELLTAKSDDVYGRTKIYEALVKGETTVEPGLPESFNVLVRELQSLCLDVELRSSGSRS